MKNFLKRVLTCAVIIMCITLCSCTQSSGPYTVTFETNGGNEIESIIVEKDQLFELPTPIKEGMAFQGWYTDKKLNNKFDSETPITKDITLYAKWGDGILISTFDELVNIKNDLSNKYLLANDIDCKGIALHSIGISVDAPFSGTFDGQGYTIYNYCFSENDYMGLFGYNTGTIKNVIVKNLDINMNQSFNNNSLLYVGAIAGCNEGTIANCVVMDSSISITVPYNDWKSVTVHKTGLITGLNKGLVKNCFVSGTVNTSNKNLKVKEYPRSGGVTGENAGTIENCFVNVKSTCTGQKGSGMLHENIGEAGGISAVNEVDGVIKNCIVLGSISSNFHCGDICSRNSGVVENCYRSSLVSTKNFYYIHGVSMTNEELSNYDFYKYTLCWDENIWKYTDLNIDESIYPQILFK